MKQPRYIVAANHLLFIKLCTGNGWSPNEVLYVRQSEAVEFFTGKQPCADDVYPPDAAKKYNLPHCLEDPHGVLPQPNVIVTEDRQTFEDFCQEFGWDSEVIAYIPSNAGQACLLPMLYEGIYHLQPKHFRSEKERSTLPKPKYIVTEARLALTEFYRICDEMNWNSLEVEYIAPFAAGIRNLLSGYMAEDVWPPSVAKEYHLPSRNTAAPNNNPAVHPDLFEFEIKPGWAPRPKTPLETVMEQITDAHATYLRIYNLASKWEITYGEAFLIVQSVICNAYNHEAAWEMLENFEKNPLK